MTDFKILSRVIPFSWKKINTEYLNDYQKKEKGVSFIETYTPYLEREDILNLLNDTLGVENWKDRYYGVNDSIYCELSIYDFNKKEWITKSDTGESKRDYLKELYIAFYKKESQLSESELKDAEKNKTLKSKSLKVFLDNASKTEATSAFKRVCSKFGIGLFLKSINDFNIAVKEETVEGKTYTRKSYVSIKNNDFISNYYDKSFNFNKYFTENCNIDKSIFRIVSTVEELKNYYEQALPILGKNNNFIKEKDVLKSELQKEKGN
jgi:hypothetical protein